MHDEHLRWQVLLLATSCVERSDHVVHVVGAHLADLRARPHPFALVVHRELGVDAEVHVGSREKRQQARQLGLQRAVPDLNVEKEERVLALRPPVDLLDERRVHAQAVHPVAAGRALRDDGDQVQRGLNRRRRIGACAIRPRFDRACRASRRPDTRRARPSSSRADCRRTRRFACRGRPRLATARGRPAISPPSSSPCGPPTRTTSCRVRSGRESGVRRSCPSVRARLHRLLFAFRRASGRAASNAVCSGRLKHWRQRPGTWRRQARRSNELRGENDHSL